MVSFENFVKSMPPSLSELKVIPSIITILDFVQPTQPIWYTS